jgi:hypothetical protein
LITIVGPPGERVARSLHGKELSEDVGGDFEGLAAISGSRERGQSGETHC